MGPSASETKYMRIYLKVHQKCAVNDLIDTSRVFFFNFRDPKGGVLEKGGVYSHNCYKLNKTIMLCAKK